MAALSSHGSPTAMHMWWGRMVHAAGVHYRGMHAARHTRLRELVRFGKGGLKHAQLLAGHANISTTGDIYSHLDVGDLAEVLRLLAANRSVQMTSRTRPQSQRKATTGVEPVYAALQAAA
jgi:integrase